MRRRALGYAVAGGILIGVSLLSAYVAHSRSRGPAVAANLDFTLQDMNGADVRLADYRGKALIVNFWATWCAPCLLETPELVDLAREYEDQGLAILGISYDDSPEQVRKFAEQFDVPYPLLIGRGRDDVFEAFGLGAGLPTTVFIRPDGTVAARLEGIMTKAWFQEKIDGMLAE
jgi:peroxiredoxin